MVLMGCVSRMHSLIRFDIRRGFLFNSSYVIACVVLTIESWLCVIACLLRAFDVLLRRRTDSSCFDFDIMHDPPFKSTRVHQSSSSVLFTMPADFYGLYETVVMIPPSRGASVY